MPLPKPFYDDPWPKPKREAAHALWQWHLSLLDLHYANTREAIVREHFERERALVEAAQPTSLIPEPVSRAAYAACEQHGLPTIHLAEQLSGALRLQFPIRFPMAADLGAFMSEWVVPHGRLLAGLADAAHSWQIRYVDELANAFFLTGRLAELPRDLDRDRLFIPESDLEQNGVTIDDLRKGGLTEPVRRLLWKQTIRVRDAFARGLPLVNEVSPRYARAIKRYWTGGLEVLHQIERRNYDVWRYPVELSRWNRWQILFQARFSRATFRPR